MSDSITFFKKDEITCPVCSEKFQRETLRTGRGRLIAGDLTAELRRLYEPTEKYGEIYPLVYTATVCPDCRYSALHTDFEAISGDTVEKLSRESEKRKSSLDKIFPELDYRSSRRLEEGIASYHYAMLSMEHFPVDLTPTIKQGICALRAAWLLGDLHLKQPDENYDYLRDVYYHKAWYFYMLALEYEENGKEGIIEGGHLGPDTDQNYGYDGVLYISAYLEFHHGPKDDPERRLKSLQRAKTTLGRLFGHGKASKNKPSTLLERAKDLHAAINKQLKEME
ncbi:MAG: DUF2225 domain-containing protein [Spirochaetia bacterium]